MRIRLASSLGAAAIVGYGLPSVSVLGAVSGRGPARLGPIWLRAQPRDEVALTFDDGPAPSTTPPVLELLEDLGLRATFFVLGSAVAAYPDLAREIVRRGHEVETHGMEHRHHLLHGPQWVAIDLRRSLAALASVGVRPRFFRPPYGQASTGTLMAARGARLDPVLWSCWGREFADPRGDAVAGRVASGLRPGAVVLLHDSDVYCGPGSVAAVEAALPAIADELERRHLRAVTLAELLRETPPGS